MANFWYHLPVTQNIEYIMKCALKAEEVGFDIISTQDHFPLVSESCGCIPECWTLLTAVAMRTKMRVSPLVVCTLFRNPALTAKIVTTLDHLSRGRVNLAFGAGWWREEFEAYGYEWNPPKVRVDKTIEFVEIVKRLWTEERVTYDGRYYNVKDCQLVPKPYQKPHPPLICGGAGAVMLELTAKRCDGWVGGDLEPEQYLKKREYIERKAGGRKLTYGLVISIKRTDMRPRDVEELIPRFTEIGVRDFIFFMHPASQNMEMLEEYSPVIRRIKKRHGARP